MGSGVKEQRKLRSLGRGESHIVNREQFDGEGFDRLPICNYNQYKSGTSEIEKQECK